MVEKFKDSKQGLGDMLMIYSHANPDEVEVVKSIRTYAMTLEGFTCGFCGGWGHTAKKCSTKTTIDASCKVNPAFKVVWGSFKSHFKSNLGKRKAQTTMENIQEQVVVESKKRVCIKPPSSGIISGGGGEKKKD